MFYHFAYSFHRDFSQSSSCQFCQNLKSYSISLLVQPCDLYLFCYPYWLVLSLDFSSCFGAFSHFSSQLLLCFTMSINTSGTKALGPRDRALWNLAVITTQFITVLVVLGLGIKTSAPSLH